MTTFIDKILIEAFTPTILIHILLRGGKYKIETNHIFGSPKIIDFSCSKVVGVSFINCPSGRH